MGSVKSNIGHLEASSGIAGLIKGIMIVKKGFIPPNLDLETPKPSLKLDERKIKVRATYWFKKGLRTDMPYSDPCATYSSA